MGTSQASVRTYQRISEQPHIRRWRTMQASVRTYQRISEQPHIRRWRTMQVSVRTYQRISEQPHIRRWRQTISIQKWPSQALRSAVTKHKTLSSYLMFAILCSPVQVANWHAVAVRTWTNRLPPLSTVTDRTVSQQTDHLANSSVAASLYPGIYE
jgi:hypothetical protein